MIFVEDFVSVSDKFSLYGLVVVVNFRVSTVDFQGTDKALLHHGFVYVTFDYIFRRSKTGIDAVVEVSFQSFVQNLLNLFVRVFVVVRPCIKFLDEAFSLKHT